MILQRSGSKRLVYLAGVYVNGYIERGGVVKLWTSTVYLQDEIEERSKLWGARIEIDNTMIEETSNE